jgi:trehalose/maltose transport system permease protein
MVGRSASQASEAAVHRKRARRHAPIEAQRRRAALLFVLPLIVALAGVAGWPLARTIYFAFTDATLATMETPGFAGIDNFIFLLRDRVWWRAVENTLVFALVSVGIETVLGLLIALLLDAELRGRGLLRAAVLVPWAIPTIVSAQLWRWMYNDLYGVVNTVLLALGVIDAPQAWTADPDLALAAVIAVDVWKTTPFMTLLILAGLQMLPRDLYEAAYVDGVHPLRVFWRITLPLIWPALMVAVVFRVLDALRVFDVIYVLTSNSRDTMSMSIYARQYLIEFQDVGIGSAAASLLFAVIALAVAVTVTAGRVRLGSAEAR